MSLVLKHPSSTVVYKTGSTYYAETYDGKLLSSSNSDASIVINAAIAGIPGAATRGWGGTVFIYGADYDCKTQITADVSTLTYNGIHIVGEGPATRLNFTPSGALTNGILLKVSDPRLAHLRIYGNANVTNLVQAVGIGGNPRHDYGILDGVTFDGAGSIDGVDDHYSATPTAGQKGFFMNGADASKVTFFWKIHDCDFRGLDIGAHMFDQFSTSVSQTNNTFIQCETAEKISSGQHNISNLWIQGGSAVGLYGIHLLSEGTGTANIINISNIHAELPKTGGAVTAAVYIQGPANVRLVNVFNAGTVLGRAVIDENLTRGNYDFERSFVTTPSTNWRNIGWFTGHMTGLGGMGTFMGRMADIGPTQSSVNTVDGVARILSTGASINTISGRIYTSNYFVRAANHDFITKIYNPSSSQANVRIFIGLINIYAGGSIVSTADMLNARKGVGFWIDTGVSTDWKIMHNDGTGASSVVAMSTPQAIQSALNTTLRIITNNSASTFTCKFNNIDTVISSDIPVAADDLGWLFSLENTTGADRQMRMYFGELRTDR